MPSQRLLHCTYHSSEPQHQVMYCSDYQTRAITSSPCNLQTQLATQKTDAIKSTQNTTRQRLGIAALSLGRCRLALAGYVADEWLRGNLPFPKVRPFCLSPWHNLNTWCRAREEELLYVLHKLLELRLWRGSLWASLSRIPLEYATYERSAHPVLTFSTQG